MAYAEAEYVAATRGPSSRDDGGVARTLDNATAEWAANAAELAVTGAPDVRALGAALLDADCEALSPADACPDNNLLLTDGCRLIDFEWSEVRHPAWDVAYLTVPWPTCWCSWRIPEASATRALDAYREAAVDGVPYVGTDAFAADVRTARTCWALMSVSWSLSTALREESVPTPAGPATRPRIQHRLGIAATSGTSAAGFAGQVLEITRSRWGDLDLTLAPAYR